MRSFIFTAFALTLVSSPAWAASGTWPTYAHDFQRSNRADGVADIHTGKVAWSKRMGGALGYMQSLVSDVNEDGRPEILTITGGRLVVNKYDGTVLWKGGFVGARSVLGAWNLDGTGPLEVAVDTPTGVQILSGGDGHLVTVLQTSSPNFSFATFVQLGPQGGVLVLATSRGPVVGFDFRSGLAVSQPAWTITANNENAYLAGDVDGDGAQDLVRQLDSGFEVDDPLTGAAKYTLTNMGPLAYYYLFELANVDGIPGDEIVAIDTSYIYSPTTGVYVLGVRNGQLSTLWSSTQSPAAALGADYYTVAGSAADLDGDGLMEFVYARWDGNAWTTIVADATTGTTVGSIAGEILEGITDLDGDGKLEIIARSGVLGDRTPERSTLTAYDFDSRQAGPVAKGWSFALSHVFRVPSTGHQGPWVALDIPILADFDPTTPGAELLVGSDTMQRGADTQLAVLHGIDGSIAATSAIPFTVTMSTLAWANGLSAVSSANDIVTYTSDGVASLLSSQLKLGASFTAGTYSNWIYVDSIANQSFIFSAASNPALQWLDGTHLDASRQPYVRYQEPNLASTGDLAAASYPLDPVVLLDGHSPSLVSVEQEATTQSLVAHDQTGLEAWRTALAPGSTVTTPGAYATDLTGDGYPDVLVGITDLSTTESLALFDGQSGMLVRSTPIASIQPGADQLETGSLVDVNGDGILELVAPEHADGILAIDLSTNPFGKLWLIPHGSPPAVSGTIAVAQLNAGGPQLLRSNGAIAFGPLQVCSYGGALLAASATDLPQTDGVDRNSVALVTRNASGLYDLVTAGTSNLALSRVERIAGDTLSTLWTVYALDGQVSQTVPSSGFALHDPFEVDVDNNGTEDVVFGSDDGYLYAIRSTDGSLVFAANLDAPVKHVIAANIDSDPQLEILASLATGELVAVDDTYSAVIDSADGGIDAGDGGVRDGSSPDSGDAGDSGLRAESGVSDASLDATGAPEGPSSSGCGCQAAGLPTGVASTSLTMMLYSLGFYLRRLRRRD